MSNIDFIWESLADELMDDLYSDSENNDGEENAESC